MQEITLYLKGFLKVFVVEHKKSQSFYKAYNTDILLMKKNNFRIIYNKNDIFLEMINQNNFERN